jgi:hypothetical protein
VNEWIDKDVAPPDKEYLETIQSQARAEIRAEDFREDVDKYKEKLRAKKWWHRFMPFKVIIVRRKEDG